MAQHNRDQQQQDWYDRQQNRSDREQSRYDRSRMQSQQYDNQRDQDDWAKQVPNRRYYGPYGDYGWDKDESALPEFRDPDVHIAPYERQQVGRYHNVRWNQEYNYGVEDLSGPYTGMGPKGYQRSDERVFEDVCQRLTQHGWIDASNMQVNVKDGEVTLTGTVPDRQTKRMAEDLVEGVSGVKDIHNQLHLEQQGRQMGRGGQAQSSQSGNPGGGRGRVDQVGGSGVYPASGPWPNENAPVQGESSWGQGERGAAGYQDSGSSELNIKPEEGQPKKP